MQFMTCRPAPKKLSWDGYEDAPGLPVTKKSKAFIFPKKFWPRNINPAFHIRNFIANLWFKYLSGE